MPAEKKSLRVRQVRGPRDVVRVSAGVLFLVLGLIGFVLPILQGILFTLIGAALLAPFVPLFARLRAAIHRRYPKTEEMMARLRRTWDHWTGNP